MSPDDLIIGLLLLLNSTVYQSISNPVLTQNHGANVPGQC